MRSERTALRSRRTSGAAVLYFQSKTSAKDHSIPLVSSVWSSPDRPAYPHHALAAVLQVRSRRLHVMLWRRANEPFAGAWALPGGPLLADETLGASVARQLASKLEGGHLGPLEQLETRSDRGRAPRGRRVAPAYRGLTPVALDPPLPGDTAWHPVDALPETAFDHG